jgi:hypothetical protein
MTYKVGDHVRFLNDRGSGVIRSIKNSKTAEVETPDGFISTFELSKLVSEHSLETELEKLPTGQNILAEKDFPPYLVNKKETIKPGEPLEIDLHIEELGISYRSKTNSEILSIQLNWFENKLAEAIRNRNDSFLIIHGVGNGTLRGEIHKRLKKNSFVEKFINKGKDEKGFGATEVFLKF